MMPLLMRGGSRNRDCFYPKMFDAMHWGDFLEGRLLLTAGSSLTAAPLHLGEALSRNPGYIKLRKIRAAQNISKTVSPGHGMASVLLQSPAVLPAPRPHDEVKANVTCPVLRFAPAQPFSAQIELQL